MAEELSLIERVARAYQIMSEIRTTALKAWEECQFSEPSRKKGDEKTRATLLAHLEHLWSILPDTKGASSIGRHIGFNMQNDYWDIVSYDLPEIELKITAILATQRKTPKKLGFEDLLNTNIANACLPLYRDGHYKQAVLAAYEQITSIMRKRTGLTIDGVDLANQTLSSKNPRLIIDTTGDGTTKDLQDGYASLLRGAYMAVRNVYTHRGPDFPVAATVAARHLVFASMLYIRLSKATLPPD